jgi:hypothetical protein
MTNLISLEVLDCGSQYKIGKLTKVRRIVWPLYVELRIKPKPIVKWVAPRLDGNAISRSYYLITVHTLGR